MTAPPDTLADLVALVYEPYGDIYATQLAGAVCYERSRGRSLILTCQRTPDGAHDRFEVLWQDASTTMAIYRAVTEGEDV